MYKYRMRAYLGTPENFGPWPKYDVVFYADSDEEAEEEGRACKKAFDSHDSCGSRMLEDPIREN